MTKSDGAFERRAFQVAQYLLSLGKFGVAYFLLPCLLINDACLGFEPLFRYKQLFGRQLNEYGLGFRGGGSECRAENAGGHGTERASVPWTKIRIAHHHVHGFQGDVEFFGQHLGQ